MWRLLSDSGKREAVMKLKRLMLAMKGEMRGTGEKEQKGDSGNQQA